MSRSGYSDDCDDDYLAMGRAIATRNKAMGGKRGQAFLSELLQVLDAMPVKELIQEDLVSGYDPYLIALEATPKRYFWGEEDPKPFCGVCALGAVGQARGLAMAHLDPHEPEMVAAAFGITETMAREVVYANDEGGRDRVEELFGPWHPRDYYGKPRHLRFPETPAERWARMRKWVAGQIKSKAA